MIVAYDNRGSWGWGVTVDAARADARRWLLAAGILAENVDAEVAALTVVPFTDRIADKTRAPR